MPENRLLLKSEEEKELNKLDSWKVCVVDRIYAVLVFCDKRVYLYSSTTSFSVLDT